MNTHDQHPSAAAVRSHVARRLQGGRLLRACRAPATALLLAIALPTAWAQESKVEREDASFLKQAAENGHAEVESSRLALKRTSNATVKSFAQQMIDDHTRAGKELETLAKSKGVEVSKEPSVMQQGKIKLLGRAEGAAFDAQYADEFGVKAHESTVQLFEKAQAEVKDADVKAWATKTLPTLRQHLQHAQELKRKTGGKS